LLLEHGTAPRLVRDSYLRCGNWHNCGVANATARVTATIQNLLLLRRFEHLKGAPHENVTRNFPAADIQPDPGPDRLNRAIRSKGREGEEGVTRKGRPTDFLFLLH